MKRHKYALNGLKDRVLCKEKDRREQSIKDGLGKTDWGYIMNSGPNSTMIRVILWKALYALRTSVYFNGKYKEIQVRGINLRSFPGGSGSKKSSCKAEDLGLIPGS